MKCPSEANCKLKDLDHNENLWFDLTQHNYLGKKAEVLTQQGFVKKQDDTMVKMTCKTFFFFLSCM